MKTPGMAYLLWLFGLHRFYLGRPATGLLYIFTCGGFLLWSIVDLFLIPHMVREENEATARLFRGGNQNINVQVDPERRRRRRDYDEDDEDDDDRPRRRGR